MFRYRFNTMQIFRIKSRPFMLTLIHSSPTLANPSRSSLASTASSRAK